MTSGTENNATPFFFTQTLYLVQKYGKIEVKDFNFSERSFFFNKLGVEVGTQNTMYYIGLIFGM